MDDLHEKIEETVESVIDIWLWIIGFLLSAVLLVTAPVWSVPYLVYRAFKQKEEVRENDKT